MSGSSVLVIDDEPELLASIRKILTRAGIAVKTATTAEEGLLALTGVELPSLVLTDLRMPGIGGLEVLRAVRQKHPDIPVVVVTAFASLETAIAAIREGAYDYLPKPFGPDQLLVVVERALEHRQLSEENRRLRAQLGVQTPANAPDIIGDSPPVVRLRELIRRVGPTDLGVLITGESGTGKEVVARAIHGLSNRRDRPFVPVDCASIPPSLMESELFGHERGAFTGANAQRRGLVEVAHTGTFFLDEIGELAPPVQTRLLRLLQEREFRRVGGTRIQAVDIRVIAATNRPVEKMVKDGSFREDLYHRLNVVHMHLPPLRERPEDVPLLLAHFVGRFCAEARRPELRLEPEVADLVSRYSWPGNVRELVNCARYVSSLAPGPSVRPSDLPARMRSADTLRPAAAPARTEAAPETPGMAIRYDLPYKQAKRVWLEVFEFAYLSHHLSLHDNNVSHAAKAAGIDRKSIQRLMRRNELDREALDDED